MRILILLLLMMFVLGCASAPIERGTWQACMSGAWESPEGIKTMCNSHASEACTINGQLIVARKPVDWNDTRALFALGHEVAHVLKLNMSGHQ